MRLRSSDYYGNPKPGRIAGTAHHVESLRDDLPKLDGLREQPADVEAARLEQPEHRRMRPPVAKRADDLPLA